ncbi:hypothetical protein BGZ60DRAFT_229547 [Tricladium varicosporioides]|nr:hypothetical protein BGZ60DRAFT_229547 [Hymenoscyphus varicosporioides]
MWKLNISMLHAFLGHLYCYSLALPYSSTLSGASILGPFLCTQKFLGRRYRATVVLHTHHSEMNVLRLVGRAIYQAD